jgi:hypothetical protein
MWFTVSKGTKVLFDRNTTKKEAEKVVDRVKLETNEVKYLFKGKWLGKLIREESYSKRR